MNINKFLRLASMIAKFSTVETDKGTLTSAEDLAEGVEVYVLDEETNDYVPAPDGDYETETHIITVKDGKVKTIAEKEAPSEEEELTVTIGAEEEAPIEEAPATDEHDAEIEELKNKITELEGLLQDRDAVIEELTAKLKEAEDAAKAPVEEPVKMSATVQNTARKDNPALKYFQ